MDVILAKREGKYFSAGEWTGGIALIALQKFGFWSKAF
jgi:hypothetical protein